MSLRFQRSAPAAGGDPDLLERARRDRTPVSPAVAGSLIAHGDIAGANLRRLASGALAVTTGQQPGLFTGPLYCMLKALSAVTLAEQLRGELGRDVVPVFWVAGDDHDFAEVNHCVVQSAEGKPERIVLRERAPDAAMLPVYREPVGVDGRQALEALEQLLPPSDFRTETIDWLARAYRPEHSVAEAYAQAMAELLGRFGLVVARGWHSAIKLAARDLVLESMRQAGVIEEALRARTAQLMAQGREAPVEVGEGLTLVMLESSAGRDRLRVAGDRFATRRGHQELTLDDIAVIARAEPETVSPNVLLRPVVEAAVFPTVAYVAGPGELKYLAQSEAVFDVLGVERQAFVPRVGGAFIEAKVDKVLERYDLSPEDLAGPQAALAARVAKDDLPPEVTTTLEHMRSTLEKGYATLREAAIGIDKTMEKPADNAHHQARTSLQDLEKKLVAALGRRNDTALQQLARARESLYPLNAPQERTITAASVLSRHGGSALDLAADAARQHWRAWLVAPSQRS